MDSRSGIAAAAVFGGMLVTGTLVSVGANPLSLFSGGGHGGATWVAGLIGSGVHDDDEHEDDDEWDDDEHEDDEESEDEDDD